MLTFAPPAGARPATAFQALKYLIEHGKYRQARQLAAHVSRNRATDKLTLAFTNALILKHRGELKEAAARMRAILSGHPNLTRVRQELADTLFLMGDDDAAKFHFKLLENSTESPVLRDYYNRFLGAIESRRPWRLNGYVAFAPNSNINHGVNGQIISIGGVPFRANGNEKKSGLDFAFGVNGAYRFDLSKKWSLTLGESIAGNLYRYRQYDYLVSNSLLDFAYTVGTWRFGVGVVGDRALYGLEGFEWDFGPELSVRKSFGRAGTLIATADWKRVGYDQISAYSGSETDGGLRYLYAIDSSTSVGGGFLLSETEAQVNFNAYRGYAPMVQFYKELPWGILASAEASYQWQDYRANFPLMGRPREDRLLILDVGATFRDLAFKGFAPRVEYSLIKNSSNVGLYSYNAQGLGLYVTKKF
jgi:hypothetical protein